MRFDYNALDAQGEEFVSRSVYLSGFSYAVILSALSLATSRFAWQVGGFPPTDAEWNTIDERVSRATDEVFQNMQIGSVVPLMLDVIPEMFLLCDGGTYARVDYPLLYAVLPAALIIDADTFNVPNMADLAVIGTSLTHPHLSIGGESEHTLTEPEMPSHAHLYTPPVGDIDLEDVGAPTPAASVGISTLTSSAGGDQPHNNMQPYIALYWCVVAR